MLTIPEADVKIVQRERNQKRYCIVEPKIGSILTIFKNGRSEKWVVVKINKTGRIILLYPVEKIIDKIVYYTKKRSWILKSNSWGNWFPHDNWEFSIDEDKSTSWVVYYKRTQVRLNLPGALNIRKPTTLSPIIYRTT